jgi:hypothetical protein
LHQGLAVTYKWIASELRTAVPAEKVTRK